MSLIGKNFGIVCQRTLRHVAIFDTDNLTLLYDIELPANIDGVEADPVDVVITPDRSKALVTSFNSKTLYTIDLTQDPPLSNNGAIFSDDFLGDIDITPDGKFAVIVDGDPSGQHYIVSYSVQDQSFISIVEKADAVAVSKNGNGRVYATRSTDHMLLVFNLDTTTGQLTNPGIAVDSGGLEPLNIVLSSDCRFAFVLNSKKTGQPTRNIAVFDITSPTPVLLNTIELVNIPQSAVMSCSENKLYVLTVEKFGQSGGTIEIFNFTATSPYLTLPSTITHTLPINGYSGIDQISLSSSDQYIFVSSSFDQNTPNILAVFEPNGTSHDAISDISADGGVFTRSCICPAPTTPAPTTPAPTTPAPTTPAPTTPAPTTPAPTTPAPTTPAPTTPAPTTPAPTTPAPTTPAPTTPAPTTPAPTTPAPTTPAPTTPAPTTPAPTTPAPTTPAPTTPAPTTPAPTTPAPTTPAPTTPAPTTPAPTTPAPTTPAPTLAPCPCCSVDEKPVVYAKCEFTKSESFNNITLNCVGRLLDVNVTLTGICPNKFVTIGVLVYEGSRLLSSKVCKLFTGSGTNCIPSLNAGKFCFVFDDDPCPPARTLTVRVVANYVER